MAGLNLILGFAVLLNADLHWSLWRGRPIPLGLPLLAGVYDVTGLTLAILLVDGFDNPSFVLLYPALLGFTLVFPGRTSLLYVAAVTAAYAAIAVATHGAFDAGEKADVKSLALRLSTMPATVLIGNLVVRVERQRRDEAVAAERAALAERQRVTQEIHDGIAQGLYMLALNLEANTDVIESATPDPQLGRRMRGLVRLAKQTLLDTRSLLYNLQPAMAGREGLGHLLREQAGEFSAVTGIPVEVAIDGPERRLEPVAVSEVYRVAQEALANVYKHAQASAASLRLEFRSQSLLLAITDDGVGFDTAATDGRGHGLTSMRERAARLGGVLTIESSAGGGTRLTLTVPQKEATHG